LTGTIITTLDNVRTGNREEPSTSQPYVSGLPKGGCQPKFFVVFQHSFARLIGSEYVVFRNYVAFKNYYSVVFSSK
jgi:hypothetical protein